LSDAFSKEFAVAKFDESIDVAVVQLEPTPEVRPSCSWCCVAKWLSKTKALLFCARCKADEAKSQALLLSVWTTLLPISRLARWTLMG
jgi:hypothetical protein